MARRLSLALMLLCAIVALAGPGRAQTAADDMALIEMAGEPWTGDLDGMLARGFVRVLTVYNPIYFSYEGKSAAGLLPEINRELQSRLAKWYGSGDKPLTVIALPLPRDQLIPALNAGRGDIIIANLTVTPERERLVDFGKPNLTGVKEVVVTGPGAPAVTSLDDVADVGVTVRKSSSYYEHLAALNADRAARGLRQVPVQLADEALEDHDLLDMANAGVIPAVIVDNHIAELWEQILDSITVHPGLSIHDGGTIAWAIRKDSPRLMEAVNRFNSEFKRGTLLGNVLFKRYLKNTDWMTNNLSTQSRSRLADVVTIIKTYSAQYDFDWAMIAAQGYQESQLIQSKRSPVGAVGIMQIMPTTAMDPAVNIQDIHLAEANIHAGVKYLRYLRERFFDDPNITKQDQALFAFAAYNAGPGNIERARAMARKMNLDPNVWFGNVEVATARAVSREPVIYVRNILKYYVTHRLLTDTTQARDKARQVQE